MTLLQTLLTESSTEIKLSYQTNYNGWDVTSDVPDDVKDDIAEELANFSIEFCDESGEFEQLDFTKNAEDDILKIVRKHIKTADSISIEYDKFSS